MQYDTQKNARGVKAQLIYCMTPPMHSSASSKWCGANPYIRTRCISSGAMVFLDCVAVFGAKDTCSVRDKARRTNNPGCWPYTDKDSLRTDLCTYAY